MKRGIRPVRWAVIGVAAVFAAGCSSIVKGRSQEVTFQSSPEGASVLVDGRIIGKTPITTSLQKKSGQNIVFEKEGYKTLTMVLETRMSGWFWGNIVLGGVLGSTTDGVTGAVHEYSPSQYMVTLQPASGNPVESNQRRPRSQKIKEFIVVGYDKLLSDIKSGSGQYLASLLDLLQIRDADRAAAIKKIQSLAERFESIPDFAEQVDFAFPENR